jgi:hypothetical protein
MPTAAETCACPVCDCFLVLKEAVSKDGKRFCSEQCAQGHPNDQGCDHSGCQCA